MGWPVRFLSSPLGSHLPQQRGIRLHPLGLAHRWLMLLSQLRGNGDGVERIDDALQQVFFHERQDYYLLLFDNALLLYHLQYYYSPATEKKRQHTSSSPSCSD